MEYTVKQLADLSGVSRRTLRYYDEIGLLKPDRNNVSGYRVYGPKEVDKLQQILFYRKLGVSLKKIDCMMNLPDYDEVKTLKEHHKKLIAEQKKLTQLILNLKKTIKSKERGIDMKDKEKFEGFRARMIQENESRYGQEVRQKFGEEAVEESNRKLKKMNRQEYEKMKNIEGELIGKLKEAMQTGDPAGELAQEVADLHRQWLSFYWGNYNKEAHAGIACMYVTDERFRGYYDKHQPGASQFLRDAILVYTRKLNQR